MKQFKNKEAEENFQKAKTLFQQEKYPEAIEKCKVSLNLERNPSTHVLLGEHYFWGKKLNQAIKEYLNAIMIDIHHVPAYNSLAVCMIFLEEFSKAKNYLEVALKKEATNLDHSETYFVLGYLFQVKKDFQEAAKNFKKAQDLNPNHQATKKLLQVISGPMN